jgi:hypothetical protein
MKRFTNHILTTHTGSLPRPPDLVDMILRKEAKRPMDENVLAMRVHSAVAEVVKRQAEIGITLLNDGEQGKPRCSTCIKDRLTGFEGEIAAGAFSGEAKDFSEYTGAAIASKDFGVRFLGQLRSHHASLTLTFIVSGLQRRIHKFDINRSVISIFRKFSKRRSLL